MIAGSVSAFTFSLISARSPAAAAAPTERISSTTRGRSVGRRDEQLPELLQLAEAR